MVSGRDGLKGGEDLGDMHPDLKIVAGPQSGDNEVALKGKVSVEPREG